MLASRTITQVCHFLSPCLYKRRSLSCYGIHSLSEVHIHYAKHAQPGHRRKDKKKKREREGRREGKGRHQDNQTALLSCACPPEPPHVPPLFGPLTSISPTRFLDTQASILAPNLCPSHTHTCTCTLLIWWYSDRRITQRPRERKNEMRREEKSYPWKPR